MKAIRFSHWAIQPGVHLHVAPTDKFKTVRLRVALAAPLTAEHATAHALLPLVLRRGSAKLPTQQQMALHLENLYGASFRVDTRKTGEVQVVELTMQITSPHYLPEATSLLADSVEFLADALLEPHQNNGHFDPDYVNTEKVNLGQRIEGLIDDRYGYALERCQAHMCQGEPFATYRYGNSGDLPAIDAAGLFQRYETLKQHAPIHILAVGALDPDHLKDVFTRQFSIGRGAVWDLPAPQRPEPGDVRTYTERHDISQSVLVLGCRLPYNMTSDTYASMLMYNGVLGGYSHSKLFSEVRERASLAYSAYSRMETVKGIQLLFAGIDASKYDAARDIMMRQLAAMKEGQISDEEMESTRKSMLNGLRSGLDSADHIIHQRLFGILGGRERTVEHLTEQIETVTKDDVVAVAQGVNLDTVYFLTCTEEGE